MTSPSEGTGTSSFGPTKGAGKGADRHDPLADETLRSKEMEEEVERETVLANAGSLG